MILKNKQNVEEFSTALINTIAYGYMGKETSAKMILMVDNVLLNEFGCLFCATTNPSGKGVHFGYIKLSKVLYANQKKFNLANANVDGNTINITDSQVHNIDIKVYKEFDSFDKRKIDYMQTTFNHNINYVMNVKNMLENELNKNTKTADSKVEQEIKTKEAQELEAKHKAEENARRLAAEAENKRKAAEEAEARRKAEEEARKKAVEEEARRLAEEAKERRKHVQELAQKKESDLKEEDRRLSKMVTNPSLETKDNLKDYGYIGEEITLESEGAHINIEMNLYITRFKTNHDMNRIVNGDRNNIIRTIVRMLKRGELRIKGRYQDLSNYKVSMFRVTGGMIFIRFSLK